MKKFVAFAAALCMAVSLAACGSAPSSSAPAANTDSSDTTTTSTPASQTAELEGAVTTGGSTSVEKVILAMQESFMNANPGVDVTYDPTGSGAGITGASEGTLDIGLSSRALKEDETGLVGTTFALDGIAIIVNNENTVTDLSLEQIKGLADGTITNWSEVGGPDAPVVLIGREAGSGTRDGFESIVGVEDVCVYDQELTSTGAVIAAVAANPNAFGYASLSAVDEKVKAVTVDGVEATEATVQDGSYKVQRPFVFVTKEGAELSDAAKGFIDFALSEDAHQLIIDAGAVPLA
ncbi:phosphate ABC transporter substrate-binding protein [Candidatus Allofournierella excrementigallinarum]|uniref:phosphate ABC transporter substrate-binding protein n=1 Tax=Candidatus Allofournierella excrementigallinarum TaxID=2838592 RepID=UPI00374F149D